MPYALGVAAKTFVDTALTSIDFFARDKRVQIAIGTFVLLGAVLFAFSQRPKINRGNDQSTPFDPRDPPSDPRDSLGQNNGYSSGPRPPAPPGGGIQRHSTNFSRLNSNPSSNFVTRIFLRIIINGPNAGKTTQHEKQVSSSFGNSNSTPSIYVRDNGTKIGCSWW